MIGDPAPGAESVAEHLDRMVPMEIFRMRHWGALRRISEAERAWEPVIRCHGKGKEAFTGGAVLMFGGPTFLRELQALVTVLAAFAYQPGGVTVLGRHWCTDHAACRRAERTGAVAGLLWGGNS